MNLGDLLRSLDTRPTQAIIEKNGGTKKKGIYSGYIVGTLLLAVSTYLQARRP